QTSQRFGWTWATQFNGSIGACARKGASYMASIFFEAPASAAAPSPVWRAEAPGCSVCSVNILLVEGVLNAAFGPSSHLISSAFAPANAVHVLSAITATPFEIFTAPFTPGMAFAFVASKLTTLPPNTGERAMAA